MRCGSDTWQVDKGFDDGADAVEPPTKKMRLPIQEPSVIVAEKTRMHRAWAKKNNTKEDNNSSWRPKPVYRCASKRWLAMLDNPIRLQTPLLGLVHFQWVKDVAKWADANWRIWPRLFVSHDLGSDGQ